MILRSRHYKSRSDSSFHLVVFDSTGICKEYEVFDSIPSRRKHLFLPTEQQRRRHGFWTTGEATVKDKVVTSYLRGRMDWLRSHRVRYMVDDGSTILDHESAWDDTTHLSRRKYRRPRSPRVHTVTARRGARLFVQESFHDSSRTWLIISSNRLATSGTEIVARHGNQFLEAAGRVRRVGGMVGCKETVACSIRARTGTARSKLLISSPYQPRPNIRAPCSVPTLRSLNLASD